jgi:hypothetical protein
MRNARTASERMVSVKGWPPNSKVCESCRQSFYLNNVRHPVATLTGGGPAVPPDGKRPAKVPVEVRWTADRVGQHARLDTTALTRAKVRKIVAMGVKENAQVLKNLEFKRKMTAVGQRGLAAECAGRTIIYFAGDAAAALLEDARCADCGIQLQQSSKVMYRYYGLSFKACCPTSTCNAFNVDQCLESGGAYGSPLVTLPVISHAPEVKTCSESILLKIMTSVLGGVRNEQARKADVFFPTGLGQTRLRVYVNYIHDAIENMCDRFFVSYRSTVDDYICLGIDMGWAHRGYHANKGCLIVMHLLADGSSKVFDVQPMQKAAGNGVKTHGLASQGNRISAQLRCSM